MIPLSLLLFDIDGVLVHPLGYKEALRATVDHFRRRMGLPEPVGPTDEEIAIFEACGLTNEWDSGALCLSLLLLSALEAAPGAVRGSVADTIAALRGAALRFVRPEYSPLAREIAATGEHSRTPSRLALKLLLGRAPEATHALLKEILGDIYSLEAPFTRVFQHHTLGSLRFSQTYGQTPDFESESLLATLDRPLIGEPTRERLLRAVADGTRRAALFTARPSSLPADGTQAADVRPLDLAPEGDIARELLGLESLPLIATGRMAWLAARNGAQPEEYVKPSPVQAVASIGAALSGSEAPALEAALALVERGEVGGPLAGLKGRTAQVHVFEDSANGIRAVRQAVEMLGGAGLDVGLEATGVSPEPVKREALAAVADRVVDDVNEGLRPLL